MRTKTLDRTTLETAATRGLDTGKALASDAAGIVLDTASKVRDSEATKELGRRALKVAAAARGQEVRTPRRWPWAVLGLTVGAVATTAARLLRAPEPSWSDPYGSTGTTGGSTTATTGSTGSMGSTSTSTGTGTGTTTGTTGTATTGTTTTGTTTSSTTKGATGSTPSSGTTTTTPTGVGGSH